MAGSAFGLPQLASLYDPNVAVEQAQLDRQTAYANALRQMSLEPINTNAQIGGMGYRVSPLNVVAKALQAYQANNLYQQTDQQRMQMMTSLAAALRGGQPQAGGQDFSGPQGALANPQPSSNPLDPGVHPGPTVDTDASAPPPQAAPQPVQGAQPDVLRAAFLHEFSPALETAYAKNFEPTDIKRLLQDANIDPNSALGHQLIQGQIAKQNYIAPTSGRPGGYFRDANGNITNLPQTQAGFVSVQDPTSPTGFRTVQQPGGLESIAASEGAKAGAHAAAEAPYQFEHVTTGSGATVPVSRAALAQGVRSFGQSSPPSPQPSPPQSAAPQAATDPWSTLPMRQVAGGIGQSTYNKEFDEEQAKLRGDLSKKYGDDAAAANGRIALNNQALGLVDQSDTGPGAARIADVKNLLVSYFPNTFKESDFQDTPSATISLQKDLLNAAVQRAKQQFGSRITQQEVMLMLSRGAPNVDMPKAAIKYLIGSDNAMNQYAIQKANDFGKAMQLGGDPSRFEGWYSSTFPATGALGGVHLNTANRPPLSSFNR